MVRGLRGLRGPEGCATHIPGSIPWQVASGRGIARTLFSHFGRKAPGLVCPASPG